MDCLTVGVGGDQPVRRAADDASPAALQAPARPGRPRERRYPLRDIRGAPVQDLAIPPLLPQEREDLHRSGERIARPAGEEPHRACQPRKHRLERILRTARTDVYQFRIVTAVPGEILPAEVEVCTGSDDLPDESFFRNIGHHLAVKPGSEGIESGSVHFKSE